MPKAISPNGTSLKCAVNSINPSLQMQEVMRSVRANPVGRIAYMAMATPRDVALLFPAEPPGKRLVVFLNLLICKELWAGELLAGIPLLNYARNAYFL